MAYYVVHQGVFLDSYDTVEEAAARARELPGARVVGEEWVGLGTVKNRVREAGLLLEEVRTLIDTREFERMRDALREVDTLLDAQFEKVGLEPEEE